MSSRDEERDRDEKGKRPNEVSHGHVQPGSDRDRDVSPTGTTSGGQAGRVEDLEDAGRKPNSPLEFDKDKAD